jgi:hypothetical protein
VALQRESDSWFAALIVDSIVDGIVDMYNIIVDNGICWLAVPL